ncbi:glycoside hydrolase family 28 protein [Phocaeicola plebeius]|uniref:glycoside hydrolase family 28 protein n=1 Tax=Phocaeicola plebeius TaxID=310297 RepID=UPI002942BAB0|nr:glycoside hydrolase family 28 protein [Phocaeicola plebeius]
MKKQFIFILCGLFLCAGTIAATDYNVLHQGAVGDGKTLNTQSLQSAIDALHAKGGGQLYFPAGRYLTGSLQLKSNVTLYLEKEAVLLGSTSPYDYPGFSTEKELKVNNDHFDQALIYVEGAENIDITGEGCIDGQGRELALTIDSLHHTGELVDKHYNTYRKRPNTRPKLLFMRNCRKVELRKTNFRSGAAWGLSFSLCADLTIDSLHVENRAYWNNDGIDISDCKEVRISNCFINSADDGICLKSHNRGAWNDRVSISNCHIISSASAIKFGTESLGGFKNVTIDNIRIKDTFRSAIAIESVDGAEIENVKLENIEIVCPGRATRGMAYMSVSRLKDVPENEKGYPEFTMFEELPSWGFYVRHVKGIQMHNVKLRLQEDDFRPAFVFDRVSNVRLSGISLPENKKAGQVVLRQTSLQSADNAVKEYITEVE